VNTNISGISSVRDSQSSLSWIDDIVFIVFDRTLENPSKSFFQAIMQMTEYRFWFVHSAAGELLVNRVRP
jgi:hypothetical protein